jgi:hypothetical protein
MLETHLHKCPYALIAGLMHKHGIPIKEKLRTFIPNFSIDFYLSGLKGNQGAHSELLDPTSRTLG